jgi:SAM-dependent methyltransferase
LRRQGAAVQGVAEIHDTARLTGRAFFEVYAKPGDRILDVGSLDVNGTLKPFVPVGCHYAGVDRAAGPNVDIVLDDPYRLPFRDEFDLAVSTSCFEHAEFFWLVFAEMARVVRSGGFLYISAPTGGVVHRHPVDCWRFYPDAGMALQHWAERAGSSVTLIESFVLPPGGEGWSDFVAVWQRDPAERWAGPRIADRFPGAVHRRP